MGYISAILISPEFSSSLIQAAKSFHNLDCNSITECNSNIAWFNSINCHEFSTQGIFQNQVQQLISSFEWILETASQLFPELNENDSKNLFIELLPLLGGFDIAVLAFAIQFFASIYDRLLNQAAQYKSRNKIITDKLEGDFKHLAILFSLHLGVTLLLIFSSSTKFIQNNPNLFAVLAFILMLGTFYLIYSLLIFCRKLIFKYSRELDTERVIEKLDKLMSLKMTTNQDQIIDAISDLCGLIRDKRIRDTERNEIIQIFRRSFNEYLDAWRDSTIAEQSASTKTAFNSITSLLQYDPTKSFEPLTDLYEESEDNVQEDILKLIYDLIQNQAQKPNNESVLNALLNQFHQVIFNYEIKRSQRNKQNLNKISFRILEKTAFDNWFNYPEENFNKLNTYSFDRLEELVDHELEKFIREAIPQGITSTNGLQFDKHLFDFECSILDLNADQETKRKLNSFRALTVKFLAHAYEKNKLDFISYLFSQNIDHAKSTDTYSSPIPFLMPPKKFLCEYFTDIVFNPANHSRDFTIIYLCSYITDEVTKTKQVAEGFREHIAPHIKIIDDLKQELTQETPNERSQRALKMFYELKCPSSESGNKEQKVVERKKEFLELLDKAKNFFNNFLEEK